MNKDLTEKLNSLKSIKASRSWKQENRDLLLKQIGLEEKEQSFAFVDFWRDFMYNFSQGLQIRQFGTITLLIVLFVFGGGFFSIKAAQKTKPGDSLYIAKIVKEKTQLALTFDKKEKARLRISFAGNRMKELQEVLKDQKVEKETVDKLIKDAKKEIDTAKKGIVEISKNKPKKEIKSSEKQKNQNKEKTKEAKQKSVENNTEKDFEKNKETKTDNSSVETSVFSANLNKDKQGIQISKTKIEANNKDGKDGEKISTSSLKTNKSSSTKESIENQKTASSSKLIEEQEEALQNNPEEILKQAEELLQAEDYQASLNKLETINDVIEDISQDKSLDGETGAVKGAYEQASTSDYLVDKKSAEEEGASSSLEKNAEE